MKKNDLDFSYNLSPTQRSKLDELLKKHSPDTVLTAMVDHPIAPETEKFLSDDKNSYAYWGPETAKLVYTPETLFLPMSFPVRLPCSCPCPCKE